MITPGQWPGAATHVSALARASASRLSQCPSAHCSSGAQRPAPLGHGGPAPAASVGAESRVILARRHLQVRLMARDIPGHQRSVDAAPLQGVLHQAADMGPEGSLFQGATSNVMSTTPRAARAGRNSSHQTAPAA